MSNYKKGNIQRGGSNLPPAPPSAPPSAANIQPASNLPPAPPTASNLPPAPPTNSNLPPAPPTNSSGSNNRGTNNKGATSGANNRGATSGANNRGGISGANNRGATSGANNKGATSGANNKGANKGGILNNIKNMASNALDKAGNKIDNIQNKGGNLLNNGKNMGGNLLNKSDNMVDNIKDGKYNKWGFIFVVAISLILIIHFVSYLVSYYYKQMDRSPLLIPHTKNAKHTVIVSQDPDSINYIPIKRSDNEEGIEFAYSFWSLILDYDYKNGEWKHMFHKGNSSSYPNRAPGVWLHPNENKMRIYMNTFDNILEYIDIDDIPVKKWFSTTIMLQNASTHSDKTKDVKVSDGPSHIMDVYINGNLKKSKLLTSIPRQNNGDLWVNLFGGFSGYISRLQYYSYAPDYTEVEAYLKQGPSEMTAQDTGEMPPYLDDKWWFK